MITRAVVIFVSGTTLLLGESAMITEEYARMSVSDMLEVHMNNMPLLDVGTIWQSCHITHTQLKGQKRRSGGWAFEHSLLVGLHTLKNNFKACSVGASILHDVVEDSEYTLEQIRKAFGFWRGRRIAFMVHALTKTKGATTEEYFHQIVRATRRCVDIIFIKLFDRLDGQEWPYDTKDSSDYLNRARSYYEETLGEFAEMCTKCRKYIPRKLLGLFDETVNKIMELAREHLAELDTLLVAS